MHENTPKVVQMRNFSSNTGCLSTFLAEGLDPALRRVDGLDEL